MKKSLLALAMTGAFAAIGTTAAHAQTNVNIYGLVDTTIRYSTNEDAAGNNKLQMTDGVLTGSRWGLRATEDLGGGLKAIAGLESGFAPETGGMLQGGRLFGRLAVVGMEGGFGSVLFGRQFTVAHDTLASFEAFAFANNPILGYQGGNYTGGRHDNMVKYSKGFGPVTLAAGYTFGEVAGNTGANSAKGVSVIYSNGPLRTGAVYQTTNNVSSAYFNAVPVAQASKQTVWGAGGTYQLGDAKLYLGYTDSELDVANAKNNVVYAGVNYQLTPSMQLIGTVQHDKLKRTAGDGKRLTSGLMLDYFLSKRTDVYVEVDYTRLKDGWIALANNAGLGAANVFGNDSRTGLMVGVRHKF